VLPILHTLLSGPRKRTRALIVTPTRELAEQIHQTVRSLSVGTNLRSGTIYGGVGSAPQIQALRKGVEIIVACPGRLLDLVAQGHANLSNVEILVLDEADRMFDMGFLPDVRRIIKAVPAQRQTMLFSATFPREVEKLASESLKQPKRIAVGISRPAHTVSHALYPVAQHLKRGLLLALLKQTDTNSVLIFTRTKHRARRLQKQIKNAGYKATSLHSDRTQGQRQRALNGFKNGQFQIMVATDIAARGLDVDSISHVINFDMPDTADAYIHRIGRTGRAKRTGDAFTLVTPDDEGMIRKLEKIMGHKLERQTIKGFNYSAPTPPQYTQSPRKPKRTVTSTPRKSDRHHRRKQYAQAKNKSNVRY
jgi:ATP-dependent RNA helicase RhlE